MREIGITLFIGNFKKAHLIQDRQFRQIYEECFPEIQDTLNLNYWIILYIRILRLYLYFVTLSNMFI
jgi:hypothetical protein